MPWIELFPPRTLESTRAWLRAQARAAETVVIGQQPRPIGRSANTSGHGSLDGHMTAPFGGTLVAPAAVADALAQWVRRAHIEVKYLPRESDRRKALVQAAYATETLVRAAHGGEVLLLTAAESRDKLRAYRTPVQGDRAEPGHPSYRSAAPGTRPGAAVVGSVAIIDRGNDDDHIDRGSVRAVSGLASGGRNT